MKKMEQPVFTLSFRDTQSTLIQDCRLILEKNLREDMNHIPLFKAGDGKSIFAM